IIVLLPLSTLFPYTTLFRSHSIFEYSSRPLGLSALQFLSCARSFAVGTHCFSAFCALSISACMSLGNATSSRKTSTSSPVPGCRSEEHTSELQSRSDLVCRL